MIINNKELDDFEKMIILVALNSFKMTFPKIERNGSVYQNVIKYIDEITNGELH